VIEKVGTECNWCKPERSYFVYKQDSSLRYCRQIKGQYELRFYKPVCSKNW